MDLSRILDSSDIGIAALSRFMARDERTFRRWMGHRPEYIPPEEIREWAARTGAITRERLGNHEDIVHITYLDPLPSDVSQDRLIEMAIGLPAGKIEEWSTGVSPASYQKWVEAFRDIQRLGDLSLSLAFKKRYLFR